MMKNVFKAWFKKAGIRAIKTFAQTSLALIPVAVKISEVDWLTVISTALLSCIVSILISIASLPELKSKSKK